MKKHSSRNMIILAEADLRWREGLQGHMETLGFKVIGCNEGAPALKALIALSPEDRQQALLITEWAMHEMKGHDLIKKMRGSDIDIPALIWTREIGKDAAFLMRAGADYATDKKNNAEYITQAIDKTLANYAARTSKKGAAAHTATGKPKDSAANNALK